MKRNECSDDRQLRLHHDLAECGRGWAAVRRRVLKRKAVKRARNANKAMVKALL